MLLHHPYQSFVPVMDFLRLAAADVPAVYQKLREAVAKAQGHVINAQLNEQALMRGMPVKPGRSGRSLRPSPSGSARAP